MARGGKREGAGRKSDGKERKAVSWKLSEDEKQFLLECLEQYRREQKMTTTIFKNFYTLGYTVMFAFRADADAVTSEEVEVELPHGAKVIELISGAPAIELANGEICDKIFTRHVKDSATPYIVDCSGNAPRNVYLKVQK